MGDKILSTVRGIIRQVLRDEFDVDTAANMEWQDDELDVLIGEYVTKISRAKPRMVREVLTTIANSRVLDISSIDDLLYIDRAEYKTGKSPRANRNIIELDDEQVEIDTTLTASAGASGTLTGTVTFASSSAAVTGAGTAFSTELEAGYHIKKSGGTRWYRIYSIESDTALTLAEASHDTGADDEDATQYCYETVYVFCAKLHTLTEDTTTLTPQLEELLVVGAAGEAAVNRARDLIDAVPAGGAGTPTRMEAWGQRRLEKFDRGLLEIQTARVYREYPKG